MKYILTEEEYLKLKNATDVELQTRLCVDKYQKLFRHYLGERVRNAVSHLRAGYNGDVPVLSITTVSCAIKWAEEQSLCDLNGPMPIGSVNGSDLPVVPTTDKSSSTHPNESKTN